MLYALLLIVPIMCVVNVVFHATSLLMILLSLEAMMLSVMFMLIGSSMFIEMSIPMISVMVLSVSACETSLGLSILVIMSRSYGSDMVNLLSMSKC
uniref:NADH-ubiquinone oxidoreductase chain 4L n=1 Tax=Erpobdella octoculata TaxID=39305 RepID=X2C893_9ANNE|nr:NADH dehydrogenase subunit 4L [Erpobdella octoculata]AGL34609.1 NADH dehydrogenase subunit 4L [Erpobdella octoculata]WDA96139.1 NADH dehydrogenase subunit 4L [Whitmania pigra]